MKAVRFRLALFVVLAVAAVAAVAVSPARAAVPGTPNTSAKTCHKGYVHAAFPWGERCIRAGQYCKKVRNPEYHKYNFQCVNGELRSQRGEGNSK